MESLRDGRHSWWVECSPLVNRGTCYLWILQVNLYINSPGGVVTAGLAIYDTMQVGYELDFTLVLYISMKNC